MKDGIRVGYLPASWLVLIAGVLLIASVFAPGRAAAQDDLEAPPGEDQGVHPDPLEPFNATMFKFNLKLDDYVLRPVATGYAAVAPEPVREGVGRFLTNVKVITYVANNLFQMRFKEAGTDLARFGINSTLGVAGFFDPAQSWFGLQSYPDDFGLTLRYYGVPGGPYLMLPVLGPSTLTDTIGMVADNAMNPMNYLLPWYIELSAGIGRRGMEAVNYRAQHLDQFEEADRYAVDLYGAVQDLYLQRRAHQLRALLYNAPPSAYESYPWVLVKAPSTNDFPDGSWDTPLGEWLTVKGYGSEMECEDALEQKQEMGELRPLQCISTTSPEYNEIVKNMSR